MFSDLGLKYSKMPMKGNPEKSHRSVTSWHTQMRHRLEICRNVGSGEASYAGNMYVFDKNWAPVGNFQQKRFKNVGKKSGACGAGFSYFFFILKSMKFQQINIDFVLKKYEISPNQKV